MDKIEKLTELIKSSNNIVFFGGAGVSVESNIPDFRSAGGLYKEKSLIPVETILSHTFFLEYPDKFYEFYKSKMLYPNAKPNACHLALSKLEELGKLKAVITQNIDNLHTEAGSKNVIELHGSVYRNHCMKCHQSYDINTILNSINVPICKCGGIIKPDVVLYEESLNMDDLTRAIKAISNCDMLIIGGTSLTVYPAAGLIQYYRGNKLVIVNKSSLSDMNICEKYASLVINDNIGEVFKKVMFKINESEGK